MPRNNKPRRQYRPGPTHINAVQIALNRCRKLDRADTRGQRLLQDRALREFAAGQHCPAHWRTLADVANMAQTLAGMGICSGADAQHIITTAQQALAAVHGRRQQRGTWTLYAAEIDALRWLLTLHDRQLAECDYGEFDTAFRRTQQRMQQARAGNAAPSAVVIVGEVA